MTKTPFLFALAASLCLAACKSTNDPAANVSDPYASNFNDGHYNPYPGSSGPADVTMPNYETPPPPASAPEPPANPYSFDAPKKTVASTSSSTPKRSTTSSSSSKPKSKPKTTASKSKSKPKPKSSSGSKVTVGKGDTLYGIALKKKTSVAKIKAANGLTSDLIRPGQTLKIP